MSEQSFVLLGKSHKMKRTAIWIMVIGVVAMVVTFLLSYLDVQNELSVVAGDAWSDFWIGIGLSAMAGGVITGSGSLVLIGIIIFVIASS